MVIHTCVSALKSFAKFGRQKRTFVGKRGKTCQPNLSQTDYSLRTGFTQQVVFWAVPCTHSTASPNDSRVNPVNTVNHLSIAGTIR